MTTTLAILGDLGGGELMMIALLALIMFGSKRLPELGRAFGRAMREFKRATSGVEENLREVMREDPLAPKIRPASRGVARNPAKPARPQDTAAASAAIASLPPPATTPPPSKPPGDDPTTFDPPAAPDSEKSAGAEDEIAS